MSRKKSRNRGVRQREDKPPSLPQKAFDLYAKGKMAQSLVAAEQAMETSGQDILLLNLAAICHVRLGKPEKAISCWRQAIRVRPDYAEAHSNLGNVLKELKRFDEAEASYRHALGIEPDYAEAHYNLGNILQEMKRFAEAEVSYRHALGIKPDYAKAHANLGVLLQALNRFEEAEASYRRALGIKPDHAEACSSLGVLLQELKRFEESEASYRHALAVRPDYAEAHYNLGNLLREMKRFEEAEASYRQALQVKPDYVEVHANLGALLQELKRFEEAEASYRQALQVKPGYVEGQWNAGLLYLSQGRFQEGWPLYESRHHPDKEERHILPIEASFPMWNGEDLAGKSLLIVSEQGFGDHLQFCRYAALLKAKGVSRLTVECAPPLEVLFASLADVDRVLVRRSTDGYPPHDFWAFYLSIPRHVATTLATIPAHLPYLRAPGDRLDRWEKRLPGRGWRVGLVWKGRPEHKNDANRSLPGLEVLAPLWSVPGISFISLQKGNGEEEADNPPQGQPLLAFGKDIRDFADTAAIVAHLDLVISVDSAVAHLAGALGKTCWVLLPWHRTDWRWLQDRADSPWYPDVLRLFRQTRTDGWSEVVQQVREALVQRSSNRSETA